jgi:hypothetical protein
MIPDRYAWVYGAASAPNRWRPMTHDLAAAADAARRSEEAGAPALDFEITPEMLAAGREELAGYSREFGHADEAVYSIFMAMMNARPKVASQC